MSLVTEDKNRAEEDADPSTKKIWHATVLEEKTDFHGGRN